MKRFFVRAAFVLLSFLTVSVFADGVFPVPAVTPPPVCMQSVLHDAPKATFCATGAPTGTSFQEVVDCNCLHQAPVNQQGACPYPALVYTGMIGKYHTIEAACEANSPGDVTECEDQWICYMWGTTGTQKPSNGTCFGLTSTPGCI